MPNRFGPLSWSWALLSLAPVAIGEHASGAVSRITLWSSAALAGWFLGERTWSVLIVILIVLLTNAFVNWDDDVHYAHHRKAFVTLSGACFFMISGYGGHELIEYYVLPFAG